VRHTSLKEDVDAVPTRREKRILGKDIADEIVLSFVALSHGRFMGLYDLSTETHSATRTECDVPLITRPPRTVAYNYFYAAICSSSPVSTCD